MGLVFNNGVAPVTAPVSNVTAIGITQIPRFAARNFEIIATFSDATTWDSGSIAYPNDGTTANFVGIQAPVGQTITRLDLLGTAGLTRFDDLAFITSAPADVGGWKTSTGASWNSASNWSTGIIPNAVGASASFRGALTTSGNIPLDGNKTVGQVVFVNSAASYTITQGTGGSLTINNAGGFGSAAIAADQERMPSTCPLFCPIPVPRFTSMVTQRSVSAATSAIPAPAALSNLAVAPPTLSGNNTYSGTTTVNLGTLNIAKPASLPGYNATGRVVVNAGGTLAVSVGGASQWASADVDNLLTNATFAAQQTITPSRLGFNTTGSDFNYSTNIAGNQGIDKIGGNTLELSGTNTYLGPTRILAGTVSASSLNSFPNTLTGSSLGNPTNAFSAIIRVGDGTNGGTLLYTGTGETTNRIIDMTGTTGGATIDQSGTGALVFAAPGGITLATSHASVTAGGNGNKTLTLQGSTSGTGEIQGVIIDDQTTANPFNPAALTSVLKTGTGTWTLSGVNTYTGSTTINQGRLVLGAFGAINTTSQIILAGGTLATGGNSQTFATAPLTLSANSTIDMGVGFSTLNFAKSSGLWTAGTVLTIDNWSGTPITGSGIDQIIFGSDNTGLSAAQVSQIKFSGFAPGATILANGEVVPTSAPYLLGDINRDGHVNVADIAAMLTELKDINAYRVAHPTLTLGDVAYISDLNADGQFNNADLQGLLDYLIQGHGSVAAVPEPSTLALVGVGALIGWTASRHCRASG